MKALIIGSAGQDGSYLREQLLARGIDVSGLARGGAALERAVEVDALIGNVKPDVLYYLAAHHHSSSDAPDADLSEVFARSFEVHVQGWVHVLEGLSRHAPHCRSFYAASSHVFGTPVTAMQSEATPFAPRSAYAISKAAGVEVARLYRSRGVHASCGILYNHESPRRPLKFVSQRIAHGAARWAAGTQVPLELGDLSAMVDWGWAPDFTDAMWRITQLEEPGDFVVATGQPHSVRDFCAAAFGAVGLDWQKCVVEAPAAVRRHLPPLVGDSTRLRAATGWAPTLRFEELVQRLVEAAVAGAGR